jgi:hypothetical protein
LLKKEIKKVRRAERRAKPPAVPDIGAVLLQIPHVPFLMQAKERFFKMGGLANCRVARKR